MFNNQLTQAVENFAQTMLPVAEKDLERTWVWKDHDEEGIRFAFFVTLQELRHLAVTLAAPSAPLWIQPTTAQRILSQYHAAYLDLQAAILGLSDQDADKAPAEGEWPVRRAYAHILGADFGFTALIRYALELHRAGNWTKDPIPESEYPRLYAISEPKYNELMESSLSNMVSFHSKFHREIIQELQDITEQELDLPSTYWEETRFPIQHRLHRYEAHIVQHTIQIDKALAAIGAAPGEAKQLLRKIYAALAEAEGPMIGAGVLDEAAILATASSILERTGEIKRILL